MSTEKLILIIAEHRIDGARVKGHEIVASHRVETPSIPHESVWETNLAQFEEPLSQIIRALGITPGTSVIVSYSSPHSVVEAISVPACGEQARRSMRLALAESVGAALTHHAIGSSPLWSTRQPQPQTLTLWAGDSDVAVGHLCSMLSRLGLRAERVVPSRAIAMYACWRSAISLKESDVVMVDLDEHVMTMCGIVGGRPRLVRQLSLGTELLVDAYARAMRTARSVDAAPPSREEAAHGVWTLGVPSREQSIDRQGATRGHHVLPLLQSVVQRIAIEIKQTIRFGLDLENRRVQVRLGGPGACVPSLASVLSDHADAVVEAMSDDGARGRVWDTESCIRRLLASLPPGVNLLPSKVVRSASSRTTRRAALVGTAIALLAIGADVGVKGRRLASIESELASLSPQATHLTEQIKLRDEAARLSGVMSETEQRLRVAMGERAAWYSALDAIRSVDEIGVRLSDISCGYEGGRAVIVLRGVATVGGTNGDALRGLMQMLAARPEFENVTLGSTRLQQTGGESVRSFTLSVGVRGETAIAAQTGENG